MSRVNKLAQILLDHSIEADNGDKVIINSIVQAKDLNKEIIKEANKRGVYVELVLTDDDYSSLLSENQAAHLDRVEDNVQQRISSYKDVKGHIRIDGFANEYNSVNVDLEKKQEIRKISRKATNVILKQKWILLNYPTHAFAQKAEMTFDDYVDFCYNAMVVDYKALKNKLLPLKELFDKTKNVKIVGPETNLTFSIKDIPTVICAGENNIPDGEIFTAPVKDSVNGTVKFNTYSIENGKKWENIKLTFENGKIVKSTCDNATEEELSKMFDVDAGARYVGEFSLGVNNEINRPIGDILYDEKIGGSFHFTPGSAYEDAYNGNDSTLHWDLVCIQTPEFGGGEIFFDDVLIRKDGKFVLPELEGLN